MRNLRARKEIPILSFFVEGGKPFLTSDQNDKDWAEVSAFRYRYL